MDYEQAYKQALENAKRLYEQGTITESLAHIFPELKESDGEGIRKNIISFLRSKNGYMNPDEDWDFHNRWLPWLEKQEESTLIKEIKRRKELFLREKEKAVLFSEKLSLSGRIAMLEELLVFAKEKQGEQTPTGTKFHEGDWIINHCGTLRHIESVDSTGYQTDGGWLTHAEYEKHFRLWNISDAKDGDVLYNAEFNYILIYKHQTGTKDFVSSCRLDLNTHTFYPCEEFEWGGLIWHPATKEQRDTLEKAMADAGYWWDAEYKELKLLMSNGGDFEANNGEQNPTWGREDERMCQETIDWLEKKCFPYALEYENPARESIRWLKSLKQKLGGKRHES